MRTAFYEGKLVNIGLGASRLDGVVLHPGQILSFWKLVGRPSVSSGFALGRAIREDALHGETGGGLCQVSGLAYELGLRAGLEVLERHPHSRDLYAEEDRFTLLGLDATVVWPWKDLRLRNPHGVPVCLRFEAGDGWLEGRVHAAEGTAAFELEVERTDFADHRKVRVSRRSAGGQSLGVSSDSYVRQGAGLPVSQVAAQPRHRYPQRHRRPLAQYRHHGRMPPCCTGLLLYGLAPGARPPGGCHATKKGEEFPALSIGYDAADQKR